MCEDHRPTRNIQRFDYKRYNSEGIKVPKVVFSEMASPLVDNEEKLRRKIDRHIRENDIDLLFDVSDLEEAISGMRSLVNSFEDVHVSLSRELGSDQYVESYPDYDKHITVITDWIREAKIAIKQKKSAAADASASQAQQARIKLVTEEKYLREKIVQDLRTYREEDSQFVSDLTDNIAAVGELQNHYTRLFLKIEELGGGFEKMFGDNYIIQNELMNESIRGMRKKIQDIKLTEHELNMKAQLYLEEEKTSKEIKSKINACNTLYQNVIDFEERKCFHQLFFLWKIRQNEC